MTDLRTANAHRSEILALEAALKAAGERRDATLVEMVCWDGLTYRQAAEVFGLSSARVGQIMQRYAQSVAGMRDFTPAERASRARDEFEAARHAQDLRCEAAGGVNDRERRAFYGSIHEAQDENAERRIGVREWRELHSLGRLEDSA